MVEFRFLRMLHEMTDAERTELARLDRGELSALLASRLGE